MKPTLAIAAATLILAASGFVSGAEPVQAPVPSTNSIVLQSMDKIRFRIAEDPSRNIEPVLLSVPANHIVDFPVSAGYPQKIAINVKGRTLEDVSKELKTRLDQEYYQDCRLEIILMDRAQKGGRVMVYGAVRQNFVELPPGEQKTILEAVLQAVASEFAKLSKVKLHRMNPATGKVESRVVDVESIKKSGDRSKDVVLLDGDRIEIPERGIVW